MWATVNKDFGLCQIIRSSPSDCVMLNYDVGIGTFSMLREQALGQTRQHNFLSYNAGRYIVLVG